MRYTKLAVLALLSFVLASPYMLAQSASTSLRGRVVDPSGAAIPGASVHLTDVDTNAAADTMTDGAGEYSFQQLKPGDYTITISAGSFGTEILEAQLLVAQPATVNAKLSVNKETTVVNVTSTTTTINTTDASVGNAFEKETISALPSPERHIDSILGLEPGVLYIGDDTNSYESRNGVVSGARADQTNLTLDGLDNNDQIFPTAFTGALRTPVDSVDEFRVTTSNSNADMGRSSGGQANVVTKSGTNTIHGALYDYNRNNWGQAQDWFAKQVLILHYNVYGAALGGPIKKDKIFLFANYEGERKDEGGTDQRQLPGPTLRAGEVAYTSYGTMGGGPVITLSPTQIASLDSCSTTCPWGPGPDPNVLTLLNSYPGPAGPNGAPDPLNMETLTYGGPQPTITNTYVSRMDYNLSDKHHFFVRGIIMNDISSELPYYPGQPPRSVDTTDSRGIGGGYIWTPTSSFVNALRYGYTRQSYGNKGAAIGDDVELRNIDFPEADIPSGTTLVPLHNVTDDLSWTKGHHTLEAGINLRHFDYINTTNFNSFDSALANASYLAGAAISGTGGPLDPDCPSAVYPVCAPTGQGPNPNRSPNDVDPAAGTNYDYAVAAVTGLLSQVTNNYNYQVSPGGASATLIGHGLPVSRDYRENEFEWYVQDQWKMKPNLTVTIGIRHSILQTPWEVHGQQVQPNIDLHQWFITRGQQAALGNSVQPDFSFSSSGKANNGKPFYPMNWLNFAPRLAFAFSPAPDAKSFWHKFTGDAGKTSIRAGFGLYYDHFGEGVVQNFSQNGSFSLSTVLTNAPGSLDVTTSPRFTNIHSVPTGVNPVQGPITYPYALPSGSFEITYGLDDHLKTPYNEVVDFSIQRELKGGFTFEADYVGRFGRHLLQALDLAQPLDLVDPKSGSDYYTAITQLDKLYDAGISSGADVAPIPYFEDMFPDAANFDTGGDGALGNSATENIYNDIFLGQATRGNETNFLFNTDVTCYPGCGGQLFRYFQDQYSSLYAYSSIGSSSYNAGQFTLRHPMSHGVQFDISYSYSRSIDMGSDTESNYYGGVGGKTTFYGQIQDAWNPWKSRAVSDFNTTHLVTGDWVIDVPVGRGKEFGNDMSRWMDEAVGGWQFDGTAHISSGLPIYGVIDNSGWATNWDIEGYTVQTGPIKMHKHQLPSGLMEAFDNPAAALANQRLPYGGEAGERNKFIGDGFFEIDTGLHKSFQIYDRLKFSLAWEVFNVTNSVRFDAHENNAISTASPTTFGTYIPGTLSDPRKMQFSGRLDF